jgi:hypothetical protein
MRAHGPGRPSHLLKFEATLITRFDQTPFFGPASGPQVNYRGFVAGESVNIFTQVIPTARGIMTDTRNTLQARAAEITTA